MPTVSQGQSIITAVAAKVRQKHTTQCHASSCRELILDISVLIVPAEAAFVEFSLIMNNVITMRKSCVSLREQTVE